MTSSRLGENIAKPHISHTHTHTHKYNLKVGKTHEKKLHWRGYTDGKWAHERYPTSLATRQMQIKSMMRQHYTPNKTAKI